jgi:hypothetical protein
MNGRISRSNADTAFVYGQDSSRSATALSHFVGASSGYPRVKLQACGRHPLQRPGRANAHLRTRFVQTSESPGGFRFALRRGKSGSKGWPCLPIPWHVVQYRVALGGVGQRDCNLRVARRKVERKPGVVQLARPVLPESVHRLSIAHRQQPLQTTATGAAAPNAPRASVQLGLKAIQVLC